MERPIIMLNTDNMPVFCRNQCANTKCAKQMTQENVCKSCEYYESCGKPERYMKCMGYKERQRAAGKQKVDVQG